MIPLFDMAGYKCKDKKRPFVQEDGKIIWEIKRIFEPNQCPTTCQKADCENRDKLVQPGTTRTPAFVHVPVGKVPQRIRITLERWFTDCGTECIEVSPSLPHPGIVAHHRMTEAALEFAVSELYAGVSPESIAARLGVGVGTIYNIKREYYPKPESPEVILCINEKMTSFEIDEIGIGKKENRITFTLIRDKTHKSLVGLVKGTSKKAIGWVLGEIRARCNIVSATMDFGNYVPIVRACWPGIDLTGDKWHFSERIKEIVKETRERAAYILSDEEVECVREWLNASAGEIVDQDEQEKAKKRASEWSIPKVLGFEQNLFRTTFKKLDKASRDRLQKWLEFLPDVKEPYRFLQKMYWLRNQTHLSPVEAKNRFWKSLYLFKVNAPKAYGTAKSFFKDRHEEILAYFDTREHNACAESFIRQVREMLIVSRGLVEHELIARLIREYGNDSPQYRFSPDGKPLTDKPYAPLVACRNAEPQPGPSRHGKHARKPYPLADPTPQNQISADPQFKLQLGPPANPPLVEPQAEVTTAVAKALRPAILSTTDQRARRSSQRKKPTLL